MRCSPALALALCVAFAVTSARANGDMRHCADVSEGPADASGPDVSDLVAMLRIQVGLDTPSEAEASRADVAPLEVVTTWRGIPIVRSRADGRLDVADLVSALRAVVGIHKYLDCYDMPRIAGATPRSACSTPGNLVRVSAFGIPADVPPGRPTQLSIRFDGVEADILWSRTGQAMVATPDLSHLPPGSPVDLRLETDRGVAIAPGQLDILGPCTGEPVVSRIEPASDAGCATSLEVVGTGLACVREAWLVGRQTGVVVPLSDLLVLGDSRLRAALPVWPEETDGAADLVVSCGDREARLESAFSLTHPPRPHVESVTPASGPSSGGIQVLLTGSGFQCARRVRLGSGALSSETSSLILTSRGELLLPDFPPAPRHTFDLELPLVVVDAQGVESAAPPTYRYVGIGLPACTSFSPASGPAAGGTQVVVSGQGMKLVKHVRFGASLVPILVSPNATTVVVTSPSTAVPGPTTLTIVNSEGYEATCDSGFTFNP